MVRKTKEEMNVIQYISTVKKFTKDLVSKPLLV